MHPSHHILHRKKIESTFGHNDVLRRIDIKSSACSILLCLMVLVDISDYVSLTLIRSLVS